MHDNDHSPPSSTEVKTLCNWIFSFPVPPSSEEGQLHFMGGCVYIYRVSQEECARLREGVPYVKVYRYNPKHLCPKLNGYGDNGQREMWSSCASTHCYPPLQTLLSQLTVSFLACGVKLRLVSRDKRLHMGFLLPSV